MLTSMTCEETQTAVKVCLTRCYEGGSAPGIIAQFIGELRMAGWEEIDIRRVEATVRRLLAGMVANDDVTYEDRRTGC